MVFLAVITAVVSGLIAFVGALNVLTGTGAPDHEWGDYLNLAACVFTFNFWLARAHYQGKPAAWTAQVTLFLIGLLGFPLFTVLNGILLFLFHKEDVRRWYTPEPI